MQFAKKFISSAAAELSESYPDGFRHDSQSPVASISRLIGNTVRRTVAQQPSWSSRQLQTQSPSPDGHSPYSSAPTDNRRASAANGHTSGPAADRLLPLVLDSLRFQSEQLRLLESLLSLTSQVAQHALQADDIDTEIEEKALEHLIRRFCLLERRHEATTIGLQAFTVELKSSSLGSRQVQHPALTVVEELMDFSTLQMESVRSLEHSIVVASDDTSSGAGVRRQASAVEQLAGTLYETLSTKHELLSSLVSELSLPQTGPAASTRTGQARRSTERQDSASIDRAFQQAVGRVSSSWAPRQEEDPAVESRKGSEQQPGKEASSSPTLLLDDGVVAAHHREELLSPPSPGRPTGSGHAALVDDLQLAVQDILDEALATMSNCDEAVQQLTQENSALREQVAELEKAVQRSEALEHASVIAEEKLKTLQLERDSAIAARAALEGEKTQALRRGEELAASLEAAMASLRVLEQRLSSQNARQQGLEAEMAHRDEIVREQTRRHKAALDKADRQVRAAEELARISQLEAEEERNQAKTLRQKLFECQAELKAAKQLFTSLEAQQRGAQWRNSSGPSAAGLPPLAGGGATSSHGAHDPLLERPTNAGGAETLLPASGVQDRVASPRSFRIPVPTVSVQPSSSTQRQTASWTNNDNRVHSPTPRRNNDAHVNRVLADARNLLQQIEAGTDCGGNSSRPRLDVGSGGPPSRSGDSGSLTASSSSSIGSINHPGADAASNPVETTRALAGEGFDKIISELQTQCQTLETEAKQLESQEAKVLERRSQLNSTLLAQRNHLLMRNAPDHEVEALNQKISLVMQQIANATGQIETNKRSVTTKLELTRLQLSVAVQRRGFVQK